MLLVATALLANACLPEPLSDAEVQARYEAAAVCGNGVTQGDEQCDDGNIDDGDGCAANCTLELTCGNGTLDDGEACDDGNASACDGCEGCQRQRAMRVGPQRPWAFQEVGKEVAALNPTFGDTFALEAWFRTAQVPATDGDDRALFLMRASGLTDDGEDDNKGFGLLGVGIQPEAGGVYKTSCLLLWRADGANQPTIGADVATGAKLLAGEWHHVRCVYDPRSGIQSGQLGVAVDGSAYAFGPVLGAGAAGWVQQRNKPIFKINQGASLFASSFFAVASFEDAASDLTPFDGVVDEVRWVTDPDAFTTEPGLAGKNVVARRWPNGRAEDALLLHMDDLGEVTKLNDASPSAFDLLSASPGTGFSQVSLKFADDSCYGVEASALTCSGDGSDTFWCAEP